MENIVHEKFNLKLFMDKTKLRLAVNQKQEILNYETILQKLKKMESRNKEDGRSKEDIEIRTAQFKRSF